DVLASKYKPVEKKVRLVPTTLPEELHVKCRFPEDPLFSLTPLLTQLPLIRNFGERLTRERWEALNIGKDGFLTEEEVKVVFTVLRNNEAGLAWTEEEKRRFRNDYFELMIIPTIEHVPWAEQNYPIPP
ncbi:hypothetical protein K439DRAFT_1305334, partial [Ramaria rubella]